MHPLDIIAHEPILEGAALARHTGDRSTNSDGGELRDDRGEEVIAEYSAYEAIKRNIWLNERGLRALVNAEDTRQGACVDDGVTRDDSFACGVGGAVIDLETFLLLVQTRDLEGDPVDRVAVLLHGGDATLPQTEIGNGKDGMIIA